MNRPCTRDEELEDFLLKHLYETENRIVLKEEESGGYREVQLNLTPKIEVLNMLFDRYLSIFTSVEDTKSMDDIWPPGKIYRIETHRGQRDMGT